eukprot:12070309-Ditylum_brightwellii.AAC.1
MSDESYQDATTIPTTPTTAHMTHLIQQLMVSQKIKSRKGTRMENIDDCAKKYCCTADFYFLTRPAQQFDIVIDIVVDRTV